MSDRHPAHPQKLRFSRLSTLDRVAEPIIDVPNRGTEVRVEPEDLPPTTVSLLQIDQLLDHYFNKVIIPTVKDINGTSVVVPVLFSNPERWAAIQKHGIWRDPRNDKLQPPMIFMRRTKIRPNKMDNPNNKYLNLEFRKTWNKRNMYDRFAVVNRITPSEEIRNVVVPDYVDINYEVIVWTTYMSQMNEVIEQINVENHEYWGLDNNFKFRVKIDEFSDDSDLPSAGDRVIRSVFRLLVSAYIVPDKMLKNFKQSSTNTKAFTTKKVVTMIEIDETS